MAVLFIAVALAQASSASGSTAPTTDVAAPSISKGEANYVDLEGGVGYSSNPLLAIVNDQGAAFGRISLHAVHSRYSERTTTLVSAYGENTSYTNHHGSLQSATLYARHDAAVSEHARLFVEGSATYQENGQLDTRVLGIPLLPPSTPGGTITPPILVPGTGDFLSVTGHEFSITGNGGGTFALSPRDNLSLIAGAEHVKFRRGAERTDYTRIPVSLGYDRQLSDRTNVGARVSAEHTDYDGPGNFSVITPQVTLRTLLSPRVTFNGAIGVSFARVDDGLRTRHSTGLAAHADLCGQGESNFYCARLSVDEQTATTAGPARSISGGIDYSHRLDANQSIAFSLSATHYSTPVSVVTNRVFSNSNYYRAAASYSRRFGSRLFGGIDLGAQKVTQNGPDPKADLTGSLFIRYRFGDLQ